VKIAFVHYGFGVDGVTRVTLNSVKGIKTIDENCEITLIAGSFNLSNSTLYQKRKITCLGIKDFPKSFKELKEKSDRLYDFLKDKFDVYDKVVLENPSIGLYPVQTLAFKKLAESNGDKFVYRVHDLVEDRPSIFDCFKKFSSNHSELVYPENVDYILLSGYSFEKLKRIKPNLNLNFIPNSIVPEDFKNGDSEILNSFRIQLIKDDVIKHDEKILLYPVRVIRRKNIEEAILVCTLLSRLKGKKYRLIVTMKYDKIKEDKDYRLKLEEVSKRKGFRCVLGGINEKYNFFGEAKNPLVRSDYGLKHLFGVADAIITTSTFEGFGFCFLEAFLADKPLIGRALKENVKDFEENGIDFSNLYSELIFNGSDFASLSNKERIEILENLSERDLIKILFENRLGKKLEFVDKEIISKNKKMVIENYDYVENAKKLLEVLNKSSGIAIPVPTPIV